MNLYEKQKNSLSDQKAEETKESEAEDFGRMLEASVLKESNSSRKRPKNRSSQKVTISNHSKASVKEKVIPSSSFLSESDSKKMQFLQMLF